MNQMVKMEARVINITVGVLIMMFLIGCTGGGSQSTPQQNFKTGVAELEINLLDNAPPDKIYEDSPFKLIVDLHNNAAYEVDNVKIALVNLDPKYFDLTELDNEVREGGSFQGRTLLSPSGDRRLVQFEGNSGFLFDNSERHVAPYSIDVSYDSTMEFAETFCINKNIYEVYDAGCKVEDRRSFSGQGSPLAITQVEEIVYPGGDSSAEFRAILNNRGKGKVQRINLINAKLGTEPIECEFQRAGLNAHKVNLARDKQKAVLICRQEFLPGQTSYTTTLALEFAYSYEVSEQKRLTLVK